MDAKDRADAIRQLDNEIANLQASPSFLPENRWHPEHQKHAAQITRLIESMRERAAELESGV